MDYVSLGDWLARLNSIQHEMRERIADVKLRFLVQLSTQLDNHAATARSYKQHVETCPFGKGLSCSWETLDCLGSPDVDTLWLKLNCPERPAVIRWEDLDLYHHVPRQISQKWWSFQPNVWIATWSYLEEVKGVSIDERAPEAQGEIEMLYSACLEACSLAPENVSSVLGNLALLDSWPGVLFYLALQRCHPLLVVSRSEMPHGQLRRGIQGEEDVTFEGTTDYVLEIAPPDVASATGYAFDALRWLAGVDAPALAVHPGDLTDEDPRLTSAEQDIMGAIREVGHRLTTKEVLDALSRKRGAASEGTTKTYLAGLVRRKLLTNRQDVIPKGYGLPEWD